MTEKALTALLEKNFKSGRFDFDALALKVFSYQFEHNHAFRTWCKASGKNPKNVSSREEVPLVPLDMFKYAYLSSFPRTEATKVFCSSGTSGKRCSLRFLNKTTFDLYRKFSTVHFFNIVPELKGKKFSVVAFTRVHPDGFVSTKLSSLYGILADFSQANFIMPGNFEESGMTTAAAQFIRTLPPPEFPTVVCINYDDLAHLAVYCTKQKVRIKLPKGSFLITGGGPKRFYVPPEELRSMSERIFGLSADSMVDSFSSTELSGRSLRRGKGGHHIPPWWKVETRNPDTLELQDPGTVGLINITDILNFNAVSFLLLPDSAYVKDGHLFHKGRGESPGYTKLLKKAIRVFGEE